jgi:hypothetical protein
VPRTLPEPLARLQNACARLQNTSRSPRTPYIKIR